MAAVAGVLRGLQENGGDADHTELCKTIERWNNVVLQAKPKN